MSMKAVELADLIIMKQAESEKRAYEGFRQKVIGATAKMAAELQLTTTVELSDVDISVLAKVTEELRELGYKFKFIEVQNASGEAIKHKLFISIQHLA